MMIPASHAATINEPYLGRTATATPAMISTTPTMYMKVWAGSGTMAVAWGARYMVQCVRMLVNLSRPKRIGATVNTVRSSRNACRAGGIVAGACWARIADADFMMLS